MAPPFNEYDLKLPLVGSLIVTGIAMVVAVPIGLASAIYLSRYAKPLLGNGSNQSLKYLPVSFSRFRFFCLRWITPNIVQQINPQARIHTRSRWNWCWNFNHSLIASVSEDALSAVPNSLEKRHPGAWSKKGNHNDQNNDSCGHIRTCSCIHNRYFTRYRRNNGGFFVAGGGGNQAQFTTSAFDSGTVVTAAMAATTAHPTGCLKV